MFRRLLLLAIALTAMLGGMTMATGGPLPQRTLAQAQDASCSGFAEWSQAYLAEERAYTEQLKTIVDTSDLRALAAATPEQLSQIVELIETHLKNLDKIDPPAFAANWQRAQAELLDLSQALFADGAINGIFTILVDYFDQNVRSNQEIEQARIDAMLACSDFDAFATEVDLIDGELDDPVPGFAPWSSCEGLDDLGLAIERANLLALVEVPAALGPLAEFGSDWDVDPSIGWNQLQFLSLADFYEALARILEQTPAPDYAMPWFQNLIAFDRAIGEIIRTGYEHGGIMAASVANGDLLTSATGSNEAAIATGTQGCVAFLHFAEQYG
jgi:hypothetical protein